MKSLGIYIHVPFCLKKCRYCDFYSLAGEQQGVIERYVSALSAHLDEYALQAKDYAVTSVYFGGGTPSLLSDKQIKALLKKIRSNYRLYKAAEISMEVNPATVSPESLAGYRRAGVNRLSIGVQSFDDDDLRRIGRVHKAEDALETVTMAGKAGFNNISIDLMFALPGQSLQTVIDNVNMAASLEVDHVSLYGLKIEDGTPFWFERDTLPLPDEEEERRMYFTAAGLLESYGFKQYEISNFAKKGKMCRHNVRYWDCEDYLGFGPAAHSYFGGKRFSFKRDLGLYLDSFDPEKTAEEPLIDEMIDIPYSSRVAEYVMLRFRLNVGVNTDTFLKRFGRSFEEMYLDRLRPYLESGHIVKTPKGYAFSREGMYVSNFILSRVVDFDMVVPGTN